jgi:antitoxin (DNA-binding transcriptional repressor) of toxin-antitoxin stability system
MAQARQQLAAVLDSVEAGDEVVIERRGIIFQVSARERKAPRRVSRPRFEVLDPSIAMGQWSWQWEASGLVVTVGAKKRKRR